jgi:hypothetical protein
MYFDRIKTCTFLLSSSETSSPFQVSYSQSIPNGTSGLLTRSFIVNTANTTSIIPSGLWDLNIWVSDNATPGLQIYYVLKIIRPDGSAVSTICTSSIVDINGSAMIEYTLTS